jgi:acyl-homoserine-lactone acylase
MDRRLFDHRVVYRTAVVGMLALCLFLGGCRPLLDGIFGRSIPPTEGMRRLPGIAHKVTVRRDTLGVPCIEADDLDDLVVAMGYVNACDRFAQMEGLRLVGQGRLSEMVGEPGIAMDSYLRALNVTEVAEMLYASASPEMRHLLQRYSDGINAYLADEPLPTMLQLTGHTPEPWKPSDSMSVFVVFTLGLAENLHEEIGILNLAQKVGPEKMAWLIPIYPDEPLPFEEMKKLEGIDLAPAARDLEDLFTVVRKANRLILPAAVASNNWAVSGKRTRSGKPIFANDAHLPLTLPSYWHLMRVRCPGYETAGVSLTGVPGIVAGYNGHIAIGMTMVMADNQDIFLEKLKREEDGLYYLYKGSWVKTTPRREVIRVKGGEDITITIHETRHGPLMNNILTHPPAHKLMPMQTDQSLGVAVSWAVFEADRTVERFFNTMKARSVDEVLGHTRFKKSIIPLNLVMADNSDIAWQVTGCFPLRKKGRGLCPSPGWTGQYDWEGFLDPFLYPFVKNPEEGYLGTANNRTVPADFPYTLSSSWHYPGRAQRIRELIEGAEEYTAQTARAMQLDTHSPFVAVIKRALLDDDTMRRMASAWADEETKERAMAGLDVLRAFQGDMLADSPGAAFCGVFLSCLGRNLFADECGGTDTVAWKSLLEIFLRTYSSLHDHLTQRCHDSPFWDDVTTGAVERRCDILARTVLDAIDLLEERCGKTPDQWRWGDLHRYEWVTDASKFAPSMGWVTRWGMRLLSGYLSRGPYPAPGDHTTLNVAGYHIGEDFDVWLIPSMRLIVDFGAEEPLTGINSTGQSDNPASPHYADGIEAWMNGEYHRFPFREENIRRQYTGTLILVPGP